VSQVKGAGREIDFNASKKNIVSLLMFFFPEPVFLKVYGAQESIPRNEFRQPM
jgi:hypothetical protein